MFPEGVVFIGGIAVFLHAKNHPETADLAAFTHDADFYVSLADMGDLRDLEQVTANRRLSKHQMIKKGFEFDIYTERQSSLLVPYDAVLASCATAGGMRIASLEHLLVLKLEAFADRRGSAKGDKDAMDLLRIAAVARRSRPAFRPSLVLPYLRDAHRELLQAVERGPHPFALASGNAKRAKELRRDFEAIVAALDGDQRHGKRRRR